MTRLTRPVRREVMSLHHGPLVVTLAEEGVYLRQKGRRTKFLIPYGVAYQRAVALTVDASRREKKARTRR